MRRVATWSAMVAVGLMCATGAWAQAAKQEPAKAPAKASAGLPTAEELIEKHLAGLGGREALGKLQSRTSTGVITMSMMGQEFKGNADLMAKAPNKSRTYLRIDLSAVGAGEVVVDQRCDGKSAFVSNSMQGDQDVTGDQLEAMLANVFPSPFLDLKANGGKIEVVGKEKVGERDAIVANYTPKSGPVSKMFFDAETYLPIRTTVKVNLPQMGEMEQLTEASDFRVVDGVKVPFVVKVINSMQVITMEMTKIEHNKPIDDAMFAKPTK